MVEDVEELCSELEIHSFVEVELSAQCKIQLMDRKSSQRVATEGSLPWNYWSKEGPNLRIGITGYYYTGVIETPAARRRWIIDIHRDILD